MRMRMHFPIPCRSFICVYLSIFVYFKMFCTFFFIKILIKSKMINVYCSYCIFLNAFCDAHCCFDMHAAHLPELCVALEYCWPILSWLSVHCVKVNDKKWTAGGWLTMCLSGNTGETEKLVFVCFMNEMRAQMAHNIPSIHFQPLFLPQRCIAQPAHTQSESKRKWKFIDLVSVHKFVALSECRRDIRGHFFSFKA